MPRVVCPVRSQQINCSVVGGGLSLRRFWFIAFFILKLRKSSYESTSTSNEHYIVRLQQVA